jgi:hypothetical protein
MKFRNHRRPTLVLVAALALAGCATPQRPAEAPAAPAAAAQPETIPARRIALDPALEKRILALDCARISADDVKTLAAGPAPRVILMHGGIYPVHLLMESFGTFLTRMGYPEARIRDPGNGEWSYSPYIDSAQIAGIIAWHYERDGVRPMMVGHSQGGIQTLKVLRELAGLIEPAIQVYDPVAGGAEARTTIVDPLTGKVRPVVGLSASYASGVAVGGAALLLPNQWKMIEWVRSVPDSVDEFVGYTIAFDSWAWTVSADGHPFRPNGTARVRNVELPVIYNHVMVPLSADLPLKPDVRAWIEAYVPGGSVDVSHLPAEAQAHVQWAADVWYDVRKHWCLEVKRLIEARRAAG